MSDCDACSSDRRDFLRTVTTALGFVMAGLAATPREAAALPMALGRALRVNLKDLTYPEPTADGAMIDRDQEVILVRWKGAVYAFNLSCPHQNTALKWADGESIFRCPRHKSEYQPDGTFVRGRATRSMDRFAVRKDGANIVVNLDLLYRNDKQPTEWAAAQVTV